MASINVSAKTHMDIEIVMHKLGANGISIDRGKVADKICAFTMKHEEMFIKEMFDKY